MGENLFSQYVTTKSIGTMNDFVVIPEIECLSGVSLSGFWYIIVPSLPQINEYSQGRNVVWVDEYSLYPLDGNKILEPLYKEQWENHSIVPTGTNLFTFFPGSNTITITNKIKEPTRYLLKFELIRLYDYETGKDIPFEKDVQDFMVHYTYKEPCISNNINTLIRKCKRTKKSVSDCNCNYDTSVHNENYTNNCNII